MITTATGISCAFCRHSRDDTDPTFIAELSHSFVLLHFNQEAYRGRCLVILKNHYEDMLDLPPEKRRAFDDEVYQVAAAVKKTFGAARINFANLGNVVPHIHTHIFPRYPGDPNDGGPPVFGEPRQRLTDDEYRSIAESIKNALK